MLEILTYIISILTGDATLTAIVNPANIMTGPVDIVTETQSGLIIPQINIYTSSESLRSVPLNTRDTEVDIDILSRTSMLEVITIYERIVELLKYNSADVSTAHIFWSKPTVAQDVIETDRRIFHRKLILQAWSQKI